MGTSTFDTYTAVPLDTAVVKVQHVSDEHHNKYNSKYSHRSRTSRDLLEYSLFYYIGKLICNQNCINLLISTMCTHPYLSREVPVRPYLQL